MKQIESDCFKIRFEGQVDQIDVNVIISCLLHSTTIIQEANTFLDTGKKIEVKICPFEKGSFIINVELVATFVDGVKALFTQENIQVASNIIVILTGLIGFKKFMGGRQAKKITRNEKETIITNQKNETKIIDNTTYNFYISNKPANEALSSAFESINKEPGINAYEILDKRGNPLTKVDKSDFAALAEDLLPEDKNERNIQIPSAILTIIGLSFDESHKWEFSYKGRRINAKIKDPKFYMKIDEGQPFAKGDMLEVEMSVKQIWDSSVNTYMDKSYQIDKINKHIPRGHQESLSF